MKKKNICMLLIGMPLCLVALEQELKTLRVELVGLQFQLNGPRPVPVPPAEEQDIHELPLPLPEQLPVAVTPTGRPLPPPPAHTVPAGLTPGSTTALQNPQMPMPAPEVQPHIPVTSTVHESKPAEPTLQEEQRTLVQKKGVTKRPELLAGKTVEILVPKGDPIAAAIGIDPETKNLVVWGPELKTEPKLETFFGTGQFYFPSLESVASVAKPNNTLEVTYHLYPPLIDTVALRAQQKDFAERVQATVAQLTAGINDAVKKSNVQNMLLAVQQNIPQAVAHIISQLQENSLRLETIYPKAFDEHVVSVDQVEQVVKTVEDDTKKVVDKLVEVFGQLLDKKQEAYKQYVSSQNLKPNEPVDYRLLAARWDKDRGYDSTRKNLKLFTDASPTLSARFAALQNWDALSIADKKELKTVLRGSLVEKSHIESFAKPEGNSFKDRLQAQKRNMVLQAVGNFYETAQNELKSVANKQAAAEAQAAAQRSFEARMQAQADALQRQQQSADQSAVAEEEWND